MKPHNSFGVPAITAKPATCEDTGMVLVLVALLPGVESATLDIRKDARPVAMALSMIVEITSETPRVTLSQPAMPAQAAPTTTAIRSETMMLSQPGSQP